MKALAIILLVCFSFGVKTPIGMTTGFETISSCSDNCGEETPKDDNCNTNNCACVCFSAYYFVDFEQETKQDPNLEIKKPKIPFKNDEAVSDYLSNCFRPPEVA